VSYLNDTREFVEKAYRSIGSMFDAFGKLRNKTNGVTTLKAIEMSICLSAA